MDPNATIKQLREALAKADTSDPTTLHATLSEAAELFGALDNWLRGYTPVISLGGGEAPSRGV